MPGSTLASGNDAAGNPFWFSGHLPAVGFNPALMARSKSTTYSGSARLESGLGAISPTAAFPSDPVQPITLTPASHGNGFANTGVLDAVAHPFMVGTIVVK